MKIFKYLLAATALLFTVTSCRLEPEDAFSTAPVAPVMCDHSDIIMTANAMDEYVNFSWEAARFCGDGNYELYAIYGGDTLALVKEIPNSVLFWNFTKEDFKALIYTLFPSLPINETSSMSFFTLINYDDVAYKADPISINVYSYGKAIAPVPVADSTRIILDKSVPGNEVGLLSWEPARLIYGQAVTYDVKLTIAPATTGASRQAANDTVVLAKDISNTYLKTTVDVLNEAVVGLNRAKEDAVNNVTFIVTAYCDSIAKGVPTSKPVTIPVTTYLATFPEKMYVPGSHQSWAIATAPTILHSTVTKGFYEGMIDLSTEDESDVQFKFSPKPAWEGDFAIDNIENTPFGAEDAYAFITGNGIAGGNITAPSAMYNIILNKKFNTLQMVQVDTLSLIGEAFPGGWGRDTNMTYDAATNTFSFEIGKKALVYDKEFKIRANHDWTHSIGCKDNTVGGGLNNVSFSFGNNMKSPADSGNYKIVLDCSVNPYVVKFVDMDMPPQLVVAGDYSGHSWKGDTDPKVYLVDAAKGLYKGYITMYDAPYGFKFVKNASVWIGSSNSTSPYSLLVGGGDNLTIANGTYYWEVDMLNLKATAVSLTAASLIGVNGDWGTDIAMTFDETTLTYSVTQAFNANSEFKFRFNGNWDYNLGGSITELKQGGDNIKVTEAGTYKVVLSIGKPNTATATLTKQ